MSKKKSAKISAADTNDWKTRLEEPQNSCPTYPVR
jgi:hypothetical protein